MSFDHMHRFVSEPVTYSFRTRRKSRFEPFHAGTELSNRGDTIYLLQIHLGLLVSQGLG